MSANTMCNDPLADAFTEGLAQPDSHRLLSVFHGSVSVMFNDPP